jgi:hypothetical protein
MMVSSSRLLEEVVSRHQSAAIRSLCACWEERGGQELDGLGSSVCRDKHVLVLCDALYPVRACTTIVYTKVCTIYMRVRQVRLLVQACAKQDAN